MAKTNNEDALVKLLRATVNITKQEMDGRLTKKADKEFQKALKDVANLLGVDADEVDKKAF